MIDSAKIQPQYASSIVLAQIDCIGITRIPEEASILTEVDKTLIRCRTAVRNLTRKCKVDLEPKWHIEEGCIQLKEFCARGSDAGMFSGTQSEIGIATASLAARCRDWRNTYESLIADLKLAVARNEPRSVSQTEGLLLALNSAAWALAGHGGCITLYPQHSPWRLSPSDPKSLQVPKSIEKSQRQLLGAVLTGLCLVDDPDLCMRQSLLSYPAAFSLYVFELPLPVIARVELDSASAITPLRWRVAGTVIGDGKSSFEPVGNLTLTSVDGQRTVLTEVLS